MAWGVKWGKGVARVGLDTHPGYLSENQRLSGSGDQMIRHWGGWGWKDHLAAEDAGRRP
jgi:hypothetical protein